MSLGEAINDAGTIPLSIARQRYKNGRLDNALLMTNSEEVGNLPQVVEWIGSNHAETKLPLQNGDKIDLEIWSLLC